MFIIRGNKACVLLVLASCVQFSFNAPANIDILEISENQSGVHTELLTLQMVMLFSYVITQITKH